MEGGRRGPRCAPLGRAALLAASPTARLALTWVISSGGDIYRVGARQGATPPSMPVHEVESGQGSSGPETCTHIIYTSQSRPPPSAQGIRRRDREGSPRSRARAGHPRAPSSTPATGARGRPGCLRGPRTAVPGPRSTPSPSLRFPSLRGASHPSIFCCQLANARGLLGPAPGPPGDWRAMLWMDGRLGGPGPCSVARCQATVTLPLRRAPAHFDGTL